MRMNTKLRKAKQLEAEGDYTKALVIVAGQILQECEYEVIDEDQYQDLGHYARDLVDLIIGDKV